MTKKERIAQLEKEVEELKQRLQILEMCRVFGVGDDTIPYLPNPYLPDNYKLPVWPKTGDPLRPIITWSDSTTSKILYDPSIQSTLT